MDDKIYMNDEGYISIENSTIFQGIIRFVFRNSRVKTVSNLNNFYNNVFSFIETSLTNRSVGGYRELNSSPAASPTISANNYSLKTLLIYMRKSVRGLENLRETYSGDIVMTSKLDIILDNVRLYSDRLEKKINDFTKHDI